MISFRITGLSPEPFAHLAGLDDAALAELNVKRCVVDRKPGYPDRVSMRDLEIGEHALLLNFEHQPAATPYRSAHAIFVKESAGERYEAVNEVPQVMRTRLLSLRAFDRGDMMLDGDVADGKEIEPLIQRFFENPDVSYIHVHNAKPGCYSGRIDRA